MSMRARLLCSLFALQYCGSVFAWENHTHLTKAVFHGEEKWASVSFERIESALTGLQVQEKKLLLSRHELAQALVIQGHKVNWDWQPPKEKSTALDVLLFSVQEPDNGMDQGLHLADYQESMGGFSGPSSQAIRYMFFAKMDWSSPFQTFHFPFHEMGFAPDRAELFLSLAVQERKNGHLFWAYRFLGWGLHYLQDLTQPYHTSQLGSLRLLPLGSLFRGKTELFREATRIVGNFHLAFEQYVEYLLLNNPDGESKIGPALIVPIVEESLRRELQRNPSAAVVARALARNSQGMASALVARQLDFIGELLLDPQTDLIPGFFDSHGKPKIDFEVLEADIEKKGQRGHMYGAMRKALANASFATHWYIDRFNSSNP